MVKIVAFPLLIMLFCKPAFSQNDSLPHQINQQVWKPFIQAFSAMDAEGFMAVHSKEMTRVIQDGKLIYGYEQYYKDSRQDNERNKQMNRKRTIELRFIQRIAANDRAFETGYYKTTSIQPDGTTRSFYGKFHVLMRKENGTWKILMDADASEKTDEAIFLTGKPMQ